MEEKDITAKKKRKRLIIIIVVGVVVVLAIAGLIAYILTRETRENDSGTVDTISRRTVETTVESTGVIDSVQLEEVSSTLIGSKIAKLYVKQGDTVVPGQIICQLDTTDLQKLYIELQKSIAEAKAEKIKTNQDYDKELSDTKYERDFQIAELQREINVANEQANSAFAELAKKQTRYDEYVDAWWEGHSAWDDIALGLEAEIDELERTVSDNQFKASAYQGVLNAILESGDDGSNNSELRDKINQISDSSIKSMEEMATELQKTISQGAVRCTVGGIITSLPVKQGDSYMGGAICTIENVNSFMIYGEVEEAKVADVTPGMKVIIKTDATGDKELNGVVTYVAPRATSTVSAGSSSVMAGTATIGASVGASAKYQVRIALNEQNPRLRLGMNAKISIITKESPNTLSVPTAALKSDDDGNYIEVVTNMDEVEKSETAPYKKEKVSVNVGVVGKDYVEISGNNVKEGEYVYVPDATEEEIMKWLGASS